MSKIRNEELELLAGEVLPERTVLSAVPMAGGTGLSICSPNTQTNSVSGNLLVLGLAQTNECGLTNSAQDVGFGLLNLLG